MMTKVNLNAKVDFGQRDFRHSEVPGSHNILHLDRSDEQRVRIQGVQMMKATLTVHNHNCSIECEHFVTAQTDLLRVLANLIDDA